MSPVISLKVVDESLKNKPNFRQFLENFTFFINPFFKSHFNPENKTKIFQIGSDRLTIIDTDGPGVLDVKFSRVSRCVQGVKHKTCFGFVAREPKKSKIMSPNQE